MATGKACKIKDCNNILKYNDGQICAMHRHRFNRHGDYNISPNWNNLKKGIPCLSPLGYYRINIDGKRILYHRYLMEKHLGRKLRKKERIHHINGIKTDNKIENLKLYSNNGKHMKECHHIMWDKRKDRYLENTIINIIRSVNRLSNPSKSCFCGGKYAARNLCHKHFQWAYQHKLL